MNRELDLGNRERRAQRVHCVQVLGVADFGKRGELWLGCYLDE